MPKADLKTFISDPKFQGDREIIGGYMEHVLSEKMKAAEEAKKSGGVLEGVFGVLFGAAKPASKDDEKSIFDIFGN